MTIKKFGLFSKVFLYTTLFLIVIILSAVGLFYRQLTDLINNEQIQNLRTSYDTLIESLSGLDDDVSMMISAQNFSQTNQSFVFKLIEENNGRVLFNTQNEDFTINPDVQSLVLNSDGFTLIAQNTSAFVTGSRIIPQFALAFLLLFLISLVFAYFFAKQLDTENKKRRQMEDSLRYFFSAASHELKTPIAGARLMLEGMLYNIGEYKNHEKYLEECINLLDIQSNTIYEILDIVKLEGDYLLSDEDVSISQLIEELHLMFLPQLEANHQTFDIQISDFSILCDRTLLKKALSNILLNAIQNTDTHKTISIYTENKKLCVLNPAFIEPDKLPHLFEPFYRIDNARTSSSGNTGLGLVIVKKTLDLLQLTYHIENTKEGVLFWITL